MVLETGWSLMVMEGCDFCHIFCPLLHSSQNALLMETFVFALPLQQLRSSVLVLRLQTHTPRKHTLAECVLSLRQLSPEETHHWLELRPPSKSRVSLWYLKSDLLQSDLDQRKKKGLRDPVTITAHLSPKSTLCSYIPH